MSRDSRLEHIAATRAKLDDEDSINLFEAFLAGDVGPVLAAIIEHRVDTATEDLREQLQAHYDERLEDIRREFRRQRDTQTRRAERASEAVARARELADTWEADCPGGPHRLCKGGQLRAVIAGTP